METRANHVWVGIVTLALLAMLAAAIVWLAQLGRGSTKDYDIFFKQSVDGVAKGHASAVLAASIFHFGTYSIAEAHAAVETGQVAGNVVLSVSGEA